MPLLHKLDEFYQSVYLLSRRIPKRHRFGIFAKIETIYFDLLELIIYAAFENKNHKTSLLSGARIKTEILKRLIRMAVNLDVIQKNQYLTLQALLQEISKMINGWIAYCNK